MKHLQITTAKNKIKKIIVALLPAVMFLASCGKNIITGSGNMQTDSKTIDGKLYLVFNGKIFGPYHHIAKILVSPDKKHFFAAVTIEGEDNMTSKMGMGNSFMVSDAGLKCRPVNEHPYL